MRGMIFDVQEMTVHDGPGCRITFFLKGCPLACRWCHNPEGQHFYEEIMFVKNRCTHCGSCVQNGKRNPELCPTGALKICGQQITSEELVQQAVKMKSTLEMMEGGVTFSGGEPCAQPEFLLDCLTQLKKEGIHTAIETSGYCDEIWFRKIIEQCDYVMMDLKLMDDHLHYQMTGVSNQKILKNAEILKNSGLSFCFRTPLIPGITDTEKNLCELALWIGQSPWEKIPYNELASVKYEQLNRTYSLK